MDKMVKSPPPITHVPLGETLIARGVVDESTLTRALLLQKATARRLGDCLIADGIKPYAVYRGLAEQAGLPFADLLKTPCADALFEPKHRLDYWRYQAVPWKMHQGRLWLAVSDLSQETRNWAEATYGSGVALAVTSPLDILWTLQRIFGALDDADATGRLRDEAPHYSASKVGVNKRLGLMLLVVAGLSLWLFPLSVGIGLLAALNVFYITSLLFRGLMFALALRRQSCLKKMRETQARRADEDLPVYTLLVPLYHEKFNVLERLKSSLLALDYPASKLDIKLVVEADDTTTHEAAKALNCPYNWEIIKVPPSQPRTKPKALNYALRFARGEFITVYDAEDQPDPQQLRKVVATFDEAAKNNVPLAAVQACLNYYNREENLLTACFALEYASWFDYMLVGMDELALPIPLGGNSNHFMRATLERLLAWDPYNVTEDADLGMRIARLGLRVAVIDSVTLEEAPIGPARVDSPAYTVD